MWRKLQQQQNEPPTQDTVPQPGQMLIQRNLKNNSQALSILWDFQTWAFNAHLDNLAIRLMIMIERVLYELMWSLLLTWFNFNPIMDK